MHGNWVGHIPLKAKVLCNIKGFVRNVRKKVDIVILGIKGNYRPINVSTIKALVPGFMTSDGALYNLILYTNSCVGL